ncbi:MAG: hypothetical protein QOG44_2744 [Acidimicrobiaceae bacterium]|nr:hypothetical protein [Acidimicrobiaceae bacterium]
MAGAGVACGGAGWMRRDGAELGRADGATGAAGGAGGAAASLPGGEVGREVESGGRIVGAGGPEGGASAPVDLVGEAGGAGGAGAGAAVGVVAIGAVGSRGGGGGRYSVANAGVAGGGGGGASVTGVDGGGTGALGGLGDPRPAAEKNWRAVASPFAGRGGRTLGDSGTGSTNSSVEPSTGILVSVPAEEGSPVVLMASQVSSRCNSIQISCFARNTNQEGE